MGSENSLRNVFNSFTSTGPKRFFGKLIKKNEKNCGIFFQLKNNLCILFLLKITKTHSFQHLTIRAEASVRNCNIALEIIALGII